MPTALTAAVVAFLVFLAVFAKGWRRRGKPLPGPPGVPLFGNVLQLPQRKVWEKLHEWGQTYGSSGFRIILTRLGCTDEFMIH